MTLKEQKVLDVLKSNPDRIFTPTQIGMALGKSYTSASSYVSGPLKTLCHMGYVANPDRGKYTIKP